MKLSRFPLASFCRFPAPAGSRLGVLAGAVMLLCAPTVYAFDSGSTGVDGALNPTASMQIQLPPSGVLNYTTVNIPEGVTVTFKKNALNTPAQVLASGDITIAGTIDIRGGTAAPTGTAGDNNQDDDGLPGLGGPGGFAGGHGGKNGSQNDARRGGSGLGPGGGRGGYERGNGCFSGMYYHSVGHSAGYATKGSRSGVCTEVADEPDRGQSYGTPELFPFIGGSGGGGGFGGTSFPGSGGGGGGGAILLASKGTLTVSGTIDATGGDAGDVAGTGVGGGGGGGSGGAIKLMATNIKGSGKLIAVGGCRVLNGIARSRCGYNVNAYDAAYTQGSDGRIRIEGDDIAFSGTSQPAYIPSAPQPLATKDIPSIRIASVGGVSVPENPMGNTDIPGAADVNLPATATDPVVVTFVTANIPAGNTVKLRVVPVYGEAIEALTAVSGTTASGSASVSVALPLGPSVLQAITSYTITVAQAESLSQYANNERVERVELVASMGGESVVELTTASGNRYTVPPVVLKIVGLAG